MHANETACSELRFITKYLEEVARLIIRTEGRKLTQEETRACRSVHIRVIIDDESVIPETHSRNLIRTDLRTKWLV